MKLGSPEHKAQFFQDLTKIYHENIWKDEMYLVQLEEIKGDKRKEIAAIDLKLENKEYKSANEGKKVKFVAERELAHLEQEIAAITQKTKELWPAKIEFVERYAKEHSA